MRVGIFKKNDDNDVRRTKHVFQLIFFLKAFHIHTFNNNNLEKKNYIYTTLSIKDIIEISFKKI